MRNLVLFALLFLPAGVYANWTLEQSDDGHWIRTENSAQHQFLAYHEQGEIQFTLILTVPKAMTTAPSRATLSIDQGPGIPAQLTVLKKRPGNLALRVELEDKKKDILIGRFVSGLALEVNFGNQQSTRFSLMGYTAAFSDLLIANEIGRINAFWLTTNGKQRELACYQMANLSVEAITARKQGNSPSDTVSQLSQHQNLVIPDAVNKIVKWAYAIPVEDLPRIPMTEKYGIFKRCMVRYVSLNR